MGIKRFDDYFKHVFIIFSLLGISVERATVYLRFYTFLISLMLIVASEISFCISKISAENMLEITRIAPCFAVGVVSILKILCIVLKLKEINDLVFSLRNLYEEITSDRIRRGLVSKNLEFLYVLLHVYITLNVFLIMIYNFSSLFVMFYYYLAKSQIKFVLPYALLLPFSTDSWLNWILVYIYSVLTGFLCVLFYMGVDMLYYVLTTHVCNHFTILANELRYFDSTNVTILRGIIIKHQFILMLSKNLDEIFTMPNFFNVLMGSVQICALGFNLMVGGQSEIVGVFFFLTSVLLQIYVMCFFGEMLMRESGKVGGAAYMCQWYNMTPYVKKFILMILIRSNREQTLTAYKFSVVSYKCMCKIISTSWTYFTLLKTVYSKRQLESNASEVI